MAGRLTGVLAGVLVTALAGCGASDRLTSATELPGAPPAPQFALHDVDGRTVRLSEFRGRIVLLTFLFTHCPDVCPLTVGKLKAALDELGRRAAGAHVVAVSVDPRGDTPAAVRAFVRRHRMEGRMTYLVGTRAQLAPVWRRYGIAVAGPPEEREVGHGSWVYGIDDSGRRRLLYGQDFTVDQIVHDLPRLAAR